MKYQYVTTKENYEFLASGRVLYSLPGQSAFSVRLSSEIIQRCFAILEARGNKGPYTIYDPCCGGGYLLTTLGFLHNNRLVKIYASDIDPQAVSLAKKNLQLLHINGLNQRIVDLKTLVDTYHKSSHIEAVEDAKKLSQILLNNIEIECFEADVTSKELTKIKNIDIIITDLPYGKLVNWKSKETDPILSFFDTISKILTPSHTVLALIANKQQKISPNDLLKVDSFKVGQRQVKIFQKKI